MNEIAPAVNNQTLRNTSVYLYNVLLIVSSLVFPFLLLSILDLYVLSWRRQFLKFRRLLLSEGRERDAFETLFVRFLAVVAVFFPSNPPVFVLFNTATTVKSFSHDKLREFEQLPKGLLIPNYHSYSH